MGKATPRLWEITVRHEGGKFHYAARSDQGEVVADAGSLPVHRGDYVQWFGDVDQDFFADFRQSPFQDRAFRGKAHGHTKAAKAIGKKGKYKYTFGLVDGPSEDPEIIIEDPVFDLDIEACLWGAALIGGLALAAVALKMLPCGKPEAAE